MLDHRDPRRNRRAMDKILLTPEEVAQALNISRTKVFGFGRFAL
jgi:hypothetical protein